MHMTYLRCLSCCYYCPDIWLAFAQFEAEYDWKKALEVIEAATEAIPDSLLLQLAFCDFLEESDHVDEAAKKYEELIEKQECLGWIQYLHFKRRQQGLQEARAFFLKAVEKCPHPQLFIAAGKSGG